MTGRAIHPLATSESWELEEDLRHIGRMASAWRTAAPPVAGDDDDRPATEPAASATVVPRAADDTAKVLSPETPAWPAAAATWLGLAALTCGLLLACWSLYAARPELMRVALPGAAAGLAGLALGQLAARR